MPEYNPERNLANQRRQANELWRTESIETPYHTAFFIDKTDSNWEDPIRAFLTANFKHHNPLKYINAVISELAATEDLSSSHGTTPKSKELPTKPEIRIEINSETITVYYWVKNARPKKFTVDRLYFLRRVNANLE